jgi:hypothetical protein
MFPYLHKIATFLTRQQNILFYVTQNIIKTRICVAPKFPSPVGQATPSLTWLVGGFSPTRSRVLFLANPCWICGRQSDTATGFAIFSRHYSTNIPHLCIHPSRTLYKSRSWQRCSTNISLALLKKELALKKCSVSLYGYLLRCFCLSFRNASMSKRIQLLSGVHWIETSEWCSTLQMWTS